MGTEISRTRVQIRIFLSPFFCPIRRRRRQMVYSGYWSYSAIGSGRRPGWENLRNLWPFLCGLCASVVQKRQSSQTIGQWWRHHKCQSFALVAGVYVAGADRGSTGRRGGNSRELRDFVDKGQRQLVGTRHRADDFLSRTRISLRSKPVISSCAEKKSASSSWASDCSRKPR